MTLRSTIYFFLIFFIAVPLFSIEKDPKPILVSPGEPGAVSQVEQSCPTFSWTAVEWAVKYSVVVFKADTEKPMAYEEMSISDNPLIHKELMGQATSWTPPFSRRLSVGSQYIWYVRAIDENGYGVWSAGRHFVVTSLPVFSEMKKKVQERLINEGVPESTIDKVFNDIRDVSEKSNATDAANDKTRTKAGSIMGSESTTNTFYGLNSGNATLTGQYNSFYGAYSGLNNTIGVSNSFLGYTAGWKNTSGSFNTFTGHSAGIANTEGANNTFTGFYAGGYNKTGNSNTFTGYGSGAEITMGSYNTFYGANSGENLTTGIANVFLGYRAGYNENGSNKLYIENTDISTPLIYGEFDNDIITIHGKLGIATKTPTADLEISRTGVTPTFRLVRSDGAALKIAAGTRNVQIGSTSDHGLKFVANGAWKMKLNTNGTLNMSDGGSYNGTWNNASSRDLKENITQIQRTEAFDALDNLDPVKYNYKTDREEQHAGFIAEDVPELVATNSRKNISTMDIVAVLTKVVKEQQKTIEKLKSEQKKLKSFLLKQVKESKRE